MPDNIVRVAITTVAAALILGTLAIALYDEPTPDYAASPYAAGEFPTNADTVLLIGNSHIYKNQLYFMLEHLAASDDRHPPLHTKSSTFGGYSLKNHYESEQSMEAIQHSDADFIILQGAGWEPFFEPEEYKEYHSLLASEASSTGAELILFQVWANAPEFWGTEAEDMDETFSHIEKITTELLAADPGLSTLAPVGRAWNDILLSSQDHDLYDPNGNLAAVTGTYLATLVLYLAIRNDGFPTDAWHPASISEEQATTLQQFARGAYR